LPLDPMNSSEGIIDTIDEALSEAGATLGDLEGVMVIKGPGSFTGLRVGLSVANQFAHQLKVPIFALRTDEWWLARTESPDALYLQTMNKAELYVSKHGRHSIEDAQNLSQFGPAVWLGQVSEDHRAWLPSDFQETHDLLSIEATWTMLARECQCNTDLRRSYELAEPFYGKDPAITKSKRQVSL